MNTENVTMVRIYLTEEKARLEKMMQHLHDVEKVKGVTVFRGITGFGQSGVMHSSSLLDMSLNLPVIVEFFDEPGRVDEILQQLSTMIDPGHVVSWSAHVNTKD